MWNGRTLPLQNTLYIPTTMENADDRHFVPRHEIVDLQIVEAVYGPGPQAGKPKIFDRTRRPRLGRVGNMFDRDARGREEPTGDMILPDLDEVSGLPENIGAG